MFKWFWTILSLGAALPVVIDWGRATVEFDIFQLNSNSHFAVTRNPIIWRLVGHSHDFLMGASYHVWVYQVIIPIKKLYRLFLFHVFREWIAGEKSRDRKKWVGTGNSGAHGPSKG